MNLAVFASGGGSNLGAILGAMGDGLLPARVVLLVTDRPGIGAIALAERAGVPVFTCAPRDFAGEDAYADALLTELTAHGADFIALAGFLKKIPRRLVEAYRDRILNIHPALLPAFGGHGLYGRRVHEAVLASGVSTTGATVHLVDEHYDTGPIVAQAVVPVEPGDTPESLAARVLSAEHRLYPETLRAFAEGRVAIEGRRVRIDDAPFPSRAR